MNKKKNENYLKEKYNRLIVTILIVSFIMIVANLILGNMYYLGLSFIMCSLSTAVFGFTLLFLTEIFDSLKFYKKVFLFLLMLLGIVFVSIGSPMGYVILSIIGYTLFIAAFVIITIILFKSFKKETAILM